MTSTHPSAQQTLAPHDAAGLSRDDLEKLYYYMQLTRTCEDRVRRLYLQSKLLGAVYSSRGQEGTAVASAYALEPQDFCAPLIRDLGATFARGVDPRRIFAQWLGRVGGPTHGRDGNLHFGDMARGVLPPISMLGSSIPLCTGVALAAVQRGEARVALAYIGDGGTNTGEFHEGLNMAAALKLPLVVIVEDNGFAYSTPVSKHVAIRTFATRAAGYGIPGSTIEGNDVIAVYEATKLAVDRARAGDGASLIEAKTFRMRGHAEHDDAFYVPRELVAEWETKDPIARLVAYMEERDLLTPEHRAEIDVRVEGEIDAALEWAESSPLPDPDSQRAGVYASRV